MIGAMLYITFYCQLVLGMSPLLSGLANVAMTVVIFIFSPIATRILNRVGPRPMLIAGPLLSASALFLLTGIRADGNYFVHVLPSLVLLGIGNSMLFVPVQNVALLGVDPRDAGVASAAVNSVFHIGGSIGLAIFTVVYAEGMSGALATGASEPEALTAGYAASFVASAIGMIAAAVIAFVLIRGSKEQLASAGHHGE